MAITVEQLESRVAALESEVRALRHRLTNNGPAESELERIKRWIRESKESQASISAGLDEMFERMGVPHDLKPIGAEEVQKLMIAEGINPEDCIFSREIKAMREE
jgi:hypothetical protein